MKALSLIAIVFLLPAICAADAPRDYKVDRFPHPPEEKLTVLVLTFGAKPDVVALEKALRAEAQVEVDKAPAIAVLASGVMADDEPMKIKDGSKHVMYEPKLKKVMTQNEWEAWRKSQGKGPNDP